MTGTPETSKPAGTGDTGLQQQPPKQQQQQQEYEFHPIANVFPLVKGEEFKQFKKDIKTNKLREPIVIYEGKILDGRNRYNACKELKALVKSGEVAVSAAKEVLNLPKEKQAELTTASKVRDAVKQGEAGQGGGRKEGGRRRHIKAVRRDRWACGQPNRQAQRDESEEA